MFVSVHSLWCVSSIECKSTIYHYKVYQVFCLFTMAVVVCKELLRCLCVNMCKNND